jgi:hypothetical protein
VRGALGDYRDTIRGLLALLLLAPNRSKKNSRDEENGGDY